MDQREREEYLEKQRLAQMEEPRSWRSLVESARSESRLCTDCVDNSEWQSSPSDSLPTFPIWGPPHPSTWTVLRPASLPTVEKASLADVEDVLSSVLLRAGYSERSLFQVPDGFALVTRVERISDDGHPAERRRWEANMDGLQSAGLLEFIDRLVFIRPGRFRMLVFIVTSFPLRFSGAEVSQAEVEQWLASGVPALSRAYVDAQFSVHHKCYALVYEFYQPDQDQRATLVRDNAISLSDHFLASGLDRLLVADVPAGTRR